MRDFTAADVAKGVDRVVCDRVLLVRVNE